MLGNFPLIYFMYSKYLLSKHQLFIQLLTFVTVRFRGLALQNKNNGIYTNLNIDTTNNAMDPYFVAFGHFINVASNIPT